MAERLHYTVETSHTHYTTTPDIGI